MKIEYEATFIDISKDKIRKELKAIGAILIKPEFTQKRIVFTLPEGNQIKGGWLRVRDEGDKITMSLKVVDGDKIENQKEVQLNIDNFDNACSLLKTIGCKEKAFQETKRELWKLGDVDVTIDEWPFLEPFVEIEGPSEEFVKNVSLRLGFEWNKAKFCSVDTLYSKKYNISEDRINNYTPKIVFEMENPFI